MYNMAKSMKMKDMLVWGAIGVGAIVAIDYIGNFGILDRIKSTVGGMTEANRASRVSYYAPLGEQFSNAYIGTAYGQGQQSMRGDYNSIPMIEF